MICNFGLVGITLGLLLPFSKFVIAQTQSLVRKSQFHKKLQLNFCLDWALIVNRSIGWIWGCLLSNDKVSPWQQMRWLLQPI